MEIQNHQGHQLHSEKQRQSWDQPSPQTKPAPPRKVNKHQNKTKKQVLKRWVEPGCKHRYSGLNCKENRPTYSHYTTTGCEHSVPLIYVQCYSDMVGKVPWYTYLYTLAAVPSFPRLRWGHPGGHPRGTESKRALRPKNDFISSLPNIPLITYSLHVLPICLVMPIPQRGNLLLHHALSCSRTSSSTHRSNIINWQLWFPRHGALCIMSTIDTQRRRRRGRLNGLCEAIPRHDSNAKYTSKTAKDQGNDATGGEPVQRKYCQRLP